MRPSHHICLAILAVSVFLRADEAPRTQDASAALIPPNVTLRIPLRNYCEGLKCLDLQVGGKARTFLFDSGGGSTLITPELAKELGSAPYGRGVGYRMNGQAVEFNYCARFHGSLGAWELQHAPVAVFDLRKLLPPELPRLDGVVALDSFRGQVLTLDWAANELRILASSDIPSALGKTGVETRIATGENGASLCVLLPVTGERETLWFLLDSGDSAGTLVAPHLQKEHSIRVDARSTARLQVGTRASESLPVTVEAINYDGVLGTHYLKDHVITLDLRHLH